MRKLFITLAGLCVALYAAAQCNTALTVNVASPVTCGGAPLQFFGFGTTDCTYPYQVHYTWHLVMLISNTDGMSIPGSEAIGTAASTTSIPMYAYSAVGPGNYRACLSVVLINDLGDTISTASACSAPVLLGPPIQLFPYTYNNACGQSNCVGFQVSGGTPPYTYSWNGLTTTSQTYCADAPGTYAVTVTDANGCAGFTTVNIETPSAANNVCENAISLENDQPITDTICFVGATTVSCANTTYYQAGWYSIESGDATQLQIAVGSNTPGTASGANGYLGNMAIEVYEEATPGSCTGSILVGCVAASTCAALSTPISVTPGKTYYVRILSQWTTSVVANILAHLSNEPAASLCGCTNNQSCNYDPDALVNDGSCGWNGCMDQGACNYLSYATCDDGSCIYGNDLSGQIFNDLNGDGIRNTYPTSEPLLGSLGSLFIEEAGITVVPNAQGNFVIPSLPLGTYTVTFTDPNGYWVLNNNTPLTLTLPTCSGLNIPLTPVSGVAANVFPASSWMWSNFHCTNGFYPGIYIQNSGTVAISGTYTIQFDPSLSSAIGNSSSSGIIDGGTATFTFGPITPGANAYYQLHILGPGVNFVGQAFSFSSTLSLLDPAGNNFYTNSWNRTAIVTCAYDPNDKSADIEGYTDQHFILADTELEYRIRFQNTGNAPAFDVVIEDQIDIENFDLSTLVPTGASHSYSTIIEPSGRVRFVFNNIMLPDSVHDEPNSHGYVAYKIRPRADVIPGAILENTAAIYFDDNPAIITNTTMHTIYDCGWWQNVGGQTEYCAGSTVAAIDNSDFVEAYQWSINGEPYNNPNPLVNPNEFVFSTDTPGDYEVGLTRTNPLCETTQSFIVHVHPVPVVDITNNNGVLSTDAEGTIFQWYLNEVPINGATSNTYTPVASGNYQVVVANEWFCNDTSSPYAFTYIGVDETTWTTAVVYPNPAQDEVRAVLPAGQYNVTVLNAQGAMVHQWNNMHPGTAMNIGGWAKGVYHFRFTDHNGRAFNATVVKN